MSAREILLKFHASIGSAHRRKILEKFGLTVKEEILPQRVWVVCCPEGKDISTLMDELIALPEVAHVEPNAEVDLHSGGEYP